ncbi:Zinc finger, PHD-type, conserved site protein [Actinidia chinensis var. chinensis]|uniref:Zinc finger, PHD-type, conserved site protein n=1 Tax=Actinidia chinensis var. chinensis TaxID=1590841 RepID=A0A2R6S215_ACTCC|nr:Zinc finger, PHD-type, conserved site protein [Actinidia chinensis var. chinensis]
MASSASTLPWIWVIEALAGFKQVDASILIDLVKRTPEISDDLGKNAREKVSLRFLESFIAQRIGSTKGLSPAPDSKIEFDPSENCEDVVRNILHEITASNLRMDKAETLKWDVEAFIMHKTASLPQCALQQLKDAILEGIHPLLSSLKERSGLSISDQSRNRVPADDGDLNAVARGLDGSCSYDRTLATGGNLTSSPENLVGSLRGDLPNRDLLPSKRDRSDLDTENLAARSREDQNSMDNGCVSHLHNIKKLKHEAALTNQAVGGNKMSEDLCTRNGQQEGSDLAKLSEMGSLEEGRSTENDHDITSERPGLRNDAVDAELQNNHPESSCNNTTVPPDTFEDGTQQDLPVNEDKDDGNNIAEMGTSDITPPDEANQNICGDEARDKCGKSKLNTSNGALLDGSYPNNFPDETKDDMQQNRGHEMSSDSDGYQNEKSDVALKKRTFLSSQCTFSEDSLATVDCTELNLCMKCNKSGQLLVCSASSCPLVVHQSCLGSEPNFDDSGNFYCPFCAYSHAISTYLEVKKKASLARKDLATFIGLENGHQGNKFSKKILRPEQNQLDDNVNDNNRTKYNGNHVKDVSQYRENVEDKQQVEHSLSCGNDNLPCQEEGATVNDRTLRDLMEGNKEGEKIGPECLSAGTLIGHQIEAQAGCNLDDDNSFSRETESVRAIRRHPENVIQQEVLQPPITDSTQQGACPSNIDVEESSEEENDKRTSNYSIRHRRREKQYTYPAIPQLRRRKVPWTSVEEEILKEGVKRFSSVHDRKWKRILEFGSNVFQKGRTTIDLKDKWRNICRGSPKSK